MFAASLLVVAVLASYVSLAVLSLSVAHGPLPIPVPGFVSTLAGKVFYQPPTLPTSVHAKTRTAVPVAGVVAADFNFPAFTEGSHQASFDVGNPLSTPLTASLGLTTSRPGVSPRLSG